KRGVTCVRVSESDGLINRQVRTFGTMTADLLALSDWLSSLNVTQVALESTGVYWRPVFNVLEDDSRTLLLVNPQHMRAVPGKKTDVRDSEWLADRFCDVLVGSSQIKGILACNPSRPEVAWRPSARTSSAQMGLFW